MAIESLKAFFLWCSIINIGLMFVTFFICICARDWASSIHQKMFGVSPEFFKMAAWSFMGLYKLLVIVFCIIPYIALLIIG